MTQSLLRLLRLMAANLSLLDTADEVIE